MLSKLIVWSGTREHTIERMLRALGEYHVGGIRTNIALFRLILNDPAFRAGDLHTGYLDDLLKTPLAWETAPSPELAEVAAQIVSKQKARGTAASTAPKSSGWLTSGREDLLR
jgi:acetyl-CoA carboxylase biotin carboxylase subunit